MFNVNPGVSLFATTDNQTPMVKKIPKQGWKKSKRGDKANPDERFEMHEEAKR